SVPPDIVGRWLAVCQVKLQSGAARPIARLFEVRRGAEHMELALGGDVPTPVNQKMTAAANAGQAWVPAVEDLREVNEKWRPAKIEPRNYAKVEYRLLGSDAFPPEFSEDETTKGSQFAIAIKESFPGGQAVRMTYSVFGVRNRTPTVLSGTAIISTVAVAPVSTMVRARSPHGFTALVVSPLQKAPDVRCPQLVKPVAPVQLAFDVHGTGRHGAPPH